jgi:hypothetical protein
VSRRASRDAALVELQRLHAAILASRERRGVGPAAPAAAAPSAEARAAQELTRRLQSDTSAADQASTEGPRPRRGWWLAVAAAVVVAGAWLAVSQSQRSEVVTEAAPPKAAPPGPGRTPGPGSAPESAPGSGSPAAATAAASPAPAATTPARPIQVTLTTIRPAWLRVTVDGARALQREVAAGETLSFAGDRAVVVRSGDAGAVQATLNGTDRGALGLRGWPLTVALTPTGIEPLTPTRPEP